MYTPVPDLSSLMREPNIPNGPLTNRCECDTRTALLRGLAEYLRQLSIVGNAGTEIAFKDAVHTWGEAAPPARLPAASVHSASEGTYEHGMDGGQISRKDEVRLIVDTNATSEVVAPYALYAHQPNDFTCDMTVEIWAAKEQRVWLMKMLEDDLNPVTWMSGFRLNLPHYHGVRGTYALKSSAYLEGPEDAKRGVYKAQCTLTGSIPQIRLMRYVKGSPRSVISVR